MVTWSADFATICSSFLEQAEKRGTVASVSTKESLRAMPRNVSLTVKFRECTAETQS